MTDRIKQAATVRAAITLYLGARKAPTFHSGAATKDDANKIGRAETALLKAVGDLINKTVTASERVKV
jgi:hypothetical protein